MRKKVYGSDISREQFERIRPLLEGVRKRTKPRTVDLYEVFCGVLYLLKSGCQWRMLPDDFAMQFLKRPGVQSVTSWPLRPEADVSRPSACDRQ